MTGFVAVTIFGFLIALWLFIGVMVPDLVRVQATSPAGYHAEVIVDGIPLSDRTRVIIWRPHLPHWTMFGCKALESYHEQPIKLTWQGYLLRIDHAYASNQIVASRTDCGSAHIALIRSLKIYS